MEHSRTRATYFAASHTPNLKNHARLLGGPYNTMSCNYSTQTYAIIHLINDFGAILGNPCKWMMMVSVYLHLGIILGGSGFHYNTWSILVVDHSTEAHERCYKEKHLIWVDNIGACLALVPPRIIRCRVITL